MMAVRRSPSRSPRRRHTAEHGDESDDAEHGDESDDSWCDNGWRWRNSSWGGDGDGDGYSWVATPCRRRWWRNGATTRSRPVVPVATTMAVVAVADRMAEMITDRMAEMITDRAGSGGQNGRTTAAVAAKDTAFCNLDTHTLRRRFLQLGNFDAAVHSQGGRPVPTSKPQSSNSCPSPST